jgi:hypothetical protein
MHQYNYPASYLTKDGKIKRSHLKKAAEFRATHSPQPKAKQLKCYTRSRADGSQYVTCDGNKSTKGKKKPAPRKQKRKGSKREESTLVGLEEMLAEREAELARIDKKKQQKGQR